jgi:hypothetical protein
MFKKKPLSAKKFFFVSLISSVGVWLLVSLFFLWIFYSRGQADNLKQEFLYLSSQENEIRALAREIKSLGGSVNDPDRFLIGRDQEEIVEFIEMIESLADTVEVDLGINFVEVSEYEDESLGEDFEFLRISLRTKGSWASTFHFLGLLESLPYKLVIDRTNLNTFLVLSEEQPVERQWTGEFLFRVAKLKQILDEDQD